MVEHSKPFSLVQISDPHLYADPAERYRGWCTHAALKAILAAIRGDGEPVDALLMTGDLAQDESAEAYGHLNTLLEPLAVPCFALPGNHDDPDAMQATLKARVLGEAHLGHWRMLLMNSHQPGTDAGYLDPGELDRLSRFLNADDRPGLIAVHHPPLSIDSPWMDSIGLHNGSALLAPCRDSGGVRAILFGHIHQAFDRDEAGLRLLGCPSTWRQFLPGAVKPAEDANVMPGYRRLTLHADGRLQTRIHRLSATALTDAEKI